MTSSRSFALDSILWALVIITGGLAGWTFEHRRAAQQEVAALLKADVDLDAAIGREQGAAERAQRAAEVKAKAALATPAAVPVQGKPDIDAILSRNPALLATYVKAIRGYLEQSYGPLFARLHLSPEQIDRLETLIVNGLENDLDLSSTAQAQGLASNDPAIVKERDQQKADLEAAEQALLGPDAYAAFHTETRAEAVRETAERVAYMTQFSAAPLTGDQSTELVQVMAQASTDFQNGKPASARTIDWDAVLAQAPSFLSPTQVATLQGVAQESRFIALARQFDAQQTSATPNPDGPHG